MAKVNNNVVTHGLSGLLGNQIVFRAGKGGRTIVATRPVHDSNRILSPSQLAHQEAFREAIAYAKTTKDEAIYINKAQGTAMSAFNAAVADWFNQPKVQEIDTNGWSGEIGQAIRVKAQDDVRVVKVHVVIRDTSGSVLEQGDAEQEDGLWWVYTTTTVISSPLTNSITATAQDLPGNSAEFIWNN